MAKPHTKQMTLKTDLPHAGLLVGLVMAAFLGCSPAAGDGGGTGGLSQSQGTGGVGASGGVTSGGTGSGGLTTGGSSSGGVGVGGAISGGASSGGAASGGGSSGGASSGGASSGGGGGVVGGAGGVGGGAGGGAGGVGTGGGGGSGAGSSVTCPSQVMPAGDSTQSVMVGGRNRTYLLHVPSGYDGTEPLALIVDFHPLGGTGQQQSNSNSWKQKADSETFIVAYPNSYNSNNSWNVGWCCQDAQQNEIDDVGFAKALVAQVSEKACVDPKRVFATGCSNGGGMTYKVMCEAADVFAAGAPVDFRCVNGGTQGSPSCVDNCSPAQPISLNHFDNTGDNALVPYNGGTTSFPANCPPGQSCVGMAFPSVDANFATWQDIDECTGSPAPLDGLSGCQGTDACAAGTQVNMCVQQGGSHCGNYSSLGIVDKAWELFQQQGR